MAIHVKLLLENLGTPHLVMYTPSRQIINEIEDSNNNIDQFDLTHRTLHPTTAKYTFFSKGHVLRQSTEWRR